jgi:beta-galactosamide-alpha-2,3-sialyltransferase
METQFPTTRFGVVFLFQKARDEDSELVYELYDEIRTKAFFSIDIVQQDGLLPAAATLLVCNLIAFLTGGQTFAAVINYYPLALAARIFPLARINTFDDGSANLRFSSIFFSAAPLAGSKVRRLLARSLFPQGCAAFLRKKTRRHYTIFPDAENIVGSDRLSPLDWTWRDFLSEEDLHLLPAKARIILLGVPFRELPVPEQSMEKARALLEQVDLYIMHPRETTWIDCSKMVRLKSPAEAVLEVLAERGPLTVYHFGSTVGYALGRHRQITFNDLLDTESDFECLS